MLGEDLTEFEEYVKEFASNTFFESEICTTCGLTLSETLSPSILAYVQIQFESIIK